MEIDVTTLAVVIVSQLVQTGQLYLLNRGQRKLSRTLMPPPLAVPPAAAQAGYCINCGNLTGASDLKGGLCASCLGTNPTEYPYADPHAAELRRRR